MPSGPLRFISRVRARRRMTAGPTPPRLSRGQRVSPRIGAVALNGAAEMAAALRAAAAGIRELPRRVDRVDRMDYVRLGATGLKVSRVCLGMMSYGHPDKWGGWVLPEEQAEPIVRRAAD